MWLGKIPPPKHLATLLNSLVMISTMASNIKKSHNLCSRSMVIMRISNKQWRADKELYPGNISRNVCLATSSPAARTPTN